MYHFTNIVLSTYIMEPYELVSSLACVVMDNVTYFVVGTGFSYPTEDEPKKGHILVFSMADSRRLHLEHKLDISGCAYSLVEVHGKLVAAINSKVHLYSWDAHQGALTHMYTHHGQVIALFLAVRGDFILVGDLMKSVTLLSYQAGSQKLVEIARDHENHYMTALEAVDDDHFIGAENSYNLFSLRKPTDASNEQEARRLLSFGSFHLGDAVNRFRKGSLNMKLPEENTLATPEMLYCTVNGSIGVIATLDETTYRLLEALQKALGEISRGVGGLSHAE